MDNMCTIQAQACCASKAKSLFGLTLDRTFLLKQLSSRSSLEEKSMCRLRADDYCRELAAHGLTAECEHCGIE